MTSKKPASKTHQLGNTAPLCNATPPPVASELARARLRSGPHWGNAFLQAYRRRLFWGGYAAQRRASLLTTKLAHPE